MANLLADIELTSAHTLTGVFADITGMSTTVDIAGTGSVVLLLMSINGDDQSSGDDTGEYRFTVDGGAVGAERTSFKDSTNKASGCTLAFAVDGLSTGSHTFAVQGADVTGGVDIDTVRVRLFQVVEITTGAEIVVDISSTSADSSSASWAVIDAMTSTITAASGRAYLMFATNPADMTTSTDNSANHSFAVGGTREGPVLHNHEDEVDEGDGVTLVWVATGVSGSTSFALQWINFNGSMATDETRPRILQVIELEAEIFDLLTDITSVTADTADTTAGVFTVVDDMTDSPTVAGTGSVLLKMFNMQALRPDGGATDIIVAYRLRTDSSQVGAEVTQFGDDIDRNPGQCLIHAETGLSAASHTFDAQWAQVLIIELDATTNTSFNRTLQVLELTAGVADVTGSGACVAPAHDVQGTGELVIEGAGACVAPAHDVQGTGELVFEGAGACVAPAHDVQGTGELVIEGAGACVAPAHDVQGTGELVFEGAGACVAPAHDVQGTGEEVFEGAGACVAPAHDVQGTGEEVFEGAGACVAPAHDVQGTGELVIEGAGACVAPAHDVQGTGTFIGLVTGAGACVAPAHDVQGTGELVFEGAGACVAPAHDVQGTGTFIGLITGAGACVAPAHDVQGTGELVFEGAGACVAPAHDVQGIGAFLEELPPIPDVTIEQPDCPFIDLHDTHAVRGEFVGETLEITRGVDVVTRAVRPCDQTLVFTRPV